MVCSRFFWVLVIIATTAMCIYLLAIVVSDWRFGPVDTTYSFIGNPDEIPGTPFPAITICTPSVVSRAFSLGYGPGETSGNKALTFFRDFFRGTDEGKTK